MFYSTDDLRIKWIKVVLPPVFLEEELPTTERASATVHQAREQIAAGTSLLTVTGLAGVGKSRLVREAFGDLIDGWISASDIQDSASLLPAAEQRRHVFHCIPDISDVAHLSYLRRGSGSRLRRWVLRHRSGWSCWRSYPCIANRPSLRPARRSWCRPRP